MMMRMKSRIQHHRIYLLQGDRWKPSGKGELRSATRAAPPEGDDLCPKSAETSNAPKYGPKTSNIHGCSYGTSEQNSHCDVVPSVNKFNLIEVNARDVEKLRDDHNWWSRSTRRGSQCLPSVIDKSAYSQ
jgi:hypothetical protein